MKTWLEFQSVRDIQIILDFTNFYRRLIKNFSRIALSLTSIVKTIGNDDLNTQANKKKKNQNIPRSSSSDIGSSVDSGIGESIENLLTGANFDKSKKSDIIKSKK